MINLDKATLPELETEFSQLKEEYSRFATKRSEVQEYAFLPYTIEIAGIEVDQFCPRHYILLDFLNNPWIKTGLPTEKDCYQFLWVVSPKFKQSDTEAYLDFVKSIEAIPYSDLVFSIEEYLMDYFSDAPRGSDEEENKSAKQSNRPAEYSWISTYVHRFAAEYGWSIDYIINKPFPVLFQLTRVMTMVQAIKNGAKIDEEGPLRDMERKLMLMNHKIKEKKFQETLLKQP